MKATDVARKLVERVLGHLGGLDAHPLDLVGEGREQRGELLAVALVADAATRMAARAEDSQALARDAGSRVRRRSADRLAATLGEPLFEASATLPTGSCEETTTSEPSGSRRAAPRALLQHPLDVSAVVVVDGRVEGHPCAAHARECPRSQVKRDAMRCGRATPRARARTPGGGRRLRPSIDRWVGVGADHLVTGVGEAGGGDVPEVPQAHHPDRRCLRRR